MEIIRIKQATTQGWIEMDGGGVADLSFPTSKTRRGRVEERGQICPTITTTGGLYRITLVKVNKEEDGRREKEDNS